MAEPNSSDPDDRAIGRAIIERAIGAKTPRKLQDRARRANRDRVANLALGALFFTVGAGLLGLSTVGFVLVGTPPGSWLVFLAILSVFGGIAVVGLNMLIQGARNRPGSEGFFYRGLGRFAARVTPVHGVLVPLGLCLLAALEGVVAKERKFATLCSVAALSWVSLFAQIFVHEIGHLLAVKRVGFPFACLVAGPVTLYPRENTYRFGVNRDWLHFVTGAVYYEASAVPSARKTLFVAMAGPIATAFLGLFALAAEETFQADVGSIAQGIARANVHFAAGILLANLMPFRLGRMESDGLQIWLALRSLAGRG